MPAPGAQGNVSGELVMVAPTEQPARKTMIKKMSRFMCGAG
jgi:hypothetical protein